jgi:hypothetical protein
MGTFPVVLDTKVAEGQGETHELSLSSHVDPASLHFQKEADHNRNTLTFVFGVFDQKGGLVKAQQRHATVDVTDAQLKGLLKAGIDVSMTFELKPGNYWVREVVTDSEQRLSALSRNIEIPKIIPAATTASAPPPPSPRSPDIQPAHPAMESANVPSSLPAKIPPQAPPVQLSPIQAPPEQPGPHSAPDPATAALLQRVWENFVQYLYSIPDVFAEEHVISSVTSPSRPIPKNGVHDSEMDSTLDSTIDSVFRLKRISTDGKTADLVESREIKYVDHQVAAKGQSLTGPAILIGAFTYAPNVFSPQFKDCYDYRLLPKMRRKPGDSALFLHADVLVLEYAVRSPLPTGIPCPLREETTGRAFIDPSSMHIVRLEQQRPRHDEGSGRLVAWSWSIEYTRITMDGRQFWLPRMISSKASSLDGTRIKWNFLANYSNYHLTTVTSTMIPAVSSSQH